MNLIDVRACFDYKGVVKLFDLSKSNEDEMSRAFTVANIASTSFGNDEPKSPTLLYDKLLKERNTCLEFIRTAPYYDIVSSLRNVTSMPYGIDPKHNDNVACVKFKAPLMVIAHIVRHRSFSYNQLSRRYVKVNKDDFYLPESYVTSVKRDAINDHINRSMNLYDQLISLGVKKEEARGVLPAYLLMSDMWMIGDKKAWQSLFKIRLFSKDERVQSTTKELISHFHSIIQEHQPKILE